MLNESNKVTLDNIVKTSVLHHELNFEYLIDYLIQL